MPMVQATKPHRHKGIMRNVGDIFSTEDRMLLETGYVKVVTATDARVEEVKVQAAEEPVVEAEAAEEKPRKDKPSKREYRRRDMNAEESKAL